ncbi:Protein 21.1 [Giardia lamblia P15]|uniref:Protein 21.1 n=1 Tax=Giardia intestinalis (strain P15) TaxID=658858 RepID=E1F5T9_GIAIA|nr:Protein 21.1 [Giardia lamblia P15]
MQGGDLQRGRGDRRPVAPIEIPDDSPALIKAVCERNRGKVEQLVRDDPDQLKGTVTCKIYGESFDDVTALMIAAVLGYHEMIEYEVNGARVELLGEQARRVNRQGMTALICVVTNFAHDTDLQRARENNEEMVEVEVRGEVRVVTRTFAGRRKCIELLLEREGDVSDRNDQTALQIATQKGYTDCIDLLYERYGELHWTALMRAAYDGDERGVRGNLQQARLVDREGRTALMLAAINGHTEVARLLLEKEWRMQDNNRKTALMHAAARGHKGVVDLLVKEQCMQDNNEWTALMHAVQNGHLRCVRELLVERGMKNNVGNIALDIARNRGYKDIVAILEGQGN